ncbi:TlpA family protein disulfide reductase [Mucilaginibacter aquatilis]|uniref:Redoxin domain-containing protein n=1 Tax=Mucilaginibacter aquatilis TaxID=1517760 RepID=A0A6I4IAL7_9SPHI|nr:TlpA disulfide reductase family protein [Mucilaginibacter aquatilis]MVN92270.1 redoxin domain-containing protein [Mucilaginibacter aquatilis]
MKYLLSICCLLFLYVQVYAQASSTTYSVRIDPNTVIKDSAGVKYDYLNVIGLLKSGKYTLVANSDSGKKNEYTLVKRQQLSVRKPESQPAAGMRSYYDSKPTESKFFTTGQLFKWFNERDINGNKWNEKTLAGKVVVLNFWFINCPPCRTEIPELNELVEKYKGNKEVVFIAIALDEKYELNSFFKLMPFNYNIVERGRFTASKYGIHLYPTNVVVNKAGKVVFHSSGYGSPTIAYIDKEIEEALKAI